MNENDSKILCIVTGGMGDEILALPALRYLQESLPAARIQIGLGGWHFRKRLFAELCHPSSPISSLETLYGKAEQSNQPIYYDWILNLDIRTLRGKVPERLQATRACFCLEQDNAHQNTVLLRPEDPYYWQHCFEIAYRCVCGVTGRSFSRSAMVSCRDSYRTVKPSGMTQLRSKIDALLSDMNSPRFRLAVTPGGYNPPYKRWAVERFAEVICHTVERGFSVFVLGAKDESELAQELWTLISEQAERRLQNASGDLTFLTGELKLEELPYILQKVDLHLSNDNGVAQIAGALNRPQIVLYRGIESPHRTLGFRDIAIFSGKDSDMNGISTEAVVQTLEQSVHQVS